MEKPLHATPYVLPVILHGQLKVFQAFRVGCEMPKSKTIDIVFVVEVGLERKIVSEHDL